MTRRLRRSAIAAVVVVLTSSAAAVAGWDAESANARGYGRATALTSGTPSATVTGSDVALAWPASNLAGSTYAVTAVDSVTTTARPILAGCAGTLGAPSCTETAPDGTWKYRVVATRGPWATSGSYSPTVTVEALNPTPTAVRLVNVATLGQARQSDRIEIDFSERLGVDSICTCWTSPGGDTANQTLDANNSFKVRIRDNGSNDILDLVSDGMSPIPNLGFLFLGANYVTGTVSFGGNGANRSKLEWNATAHTLSITLGAGSGQATGAGAATVTYTPSGNLRDLASKAVAATAFPSATAQRF